jgi:hypothetical protein
MTWLGSLPSWAIFTLFGAAVLLFTVALDTALRRRLVTDPVRARAGPTAATTLQALATIYAVLVAFVIVDEYSQLRDTQGQVSSEAAQLSVIFENSRNLPQAEGTALRTATLTYARNVARVGLPEIERTGKVSPQTDAIFEGIYHVVSGIEPRTESARAAYQQILAALSQLAQEKSNLTSSAHATIPLPLFVILALLAAAIIAVGTMMDTRHRGSHLFILGALALGLSMTLALVAALDYPYRGFIRIDASPITTFVSNRAAR